MILDIATRSIDEPFDYLIPDELLDRTGIGCVVQVPLGSRTAVGYVVEVADRSDLASLKPLAQVLSEPLFDSASAEIASWIASEYVAPLAECIRLFLAPGSSPRAVKRSDGRDTEWILERPRVTEKRESWIIPQPACEYMPAPNAHKQIRILEELKHGEIRKSELVETLGPIDAPIRRLAEVGALSIEHRRASRRPEPYRSPAPRPSELTDGQLKALEMIREANPGDVLLLDGVTGSGKTEVYLQATERVLKAGRGAIILVPEISLTPQTVGRFQSRLGDDVAVLHSRLSAGERFDEWERARRGEARVVVGARSALFAPVDDVGLIVIDEEHEYSYKQGSAPRYHARDVASRIASVREAVLVLGSATPSMESLARVEDGEWRSISLPERPTGQALPEVQVVDMGAEFREGHRSLFSRALANSLRDVAVRGFKAVLLLNRRGFASFMLCRECGHVPTCDSCSTSMTLHEDKRVLACHHCAAVRAIPPQCPECGSVYLRAFGAGTQRVEAELQRLLPDLPSVRMDADTTARKGGHEARLREFEALESGVLIGTQMVAKGLDYPEVTLVGVLNADTTLHLPDFRSAERTYQLLSQVAGRAGRGDTPGTVIVQTYWPSHPAIEAARTHDPTELHAHEREIRSELGYPPFGRLANVIFTSREDEGARKASQAVADRLSQAAPDTVAVLGPSRAPLSRLKGAYRWHILLKGDTATVLSPSIVEALKQVGPFNNVSVAVDVDPLDLM